MEGKPRPIPLIGMHRLAPVYGLSVVAVGKNGQLANIAAARAVGANGMVSLEGYMYDAAFGRVELTDRDRFSDALRFLGQTV